jgi:deoxyribodipyrimidine photo-lyase
MAGPVTLVWFRRDLRLADNPALRSAVDRGRVACLFVVDRTLLGRRHHDAPGRLRFLRAGVERLAADLRERGSRLALRRGEPETLVAEVAREVGADRVAIAEDVSPYGRARDEAVAAELARVGIELWRHPGLCLAEPDDLQGSGGAGYRVFTPFYRSWRELPLPERLYAPAEIAGPRVRVGELEGLPRGDPPIPAGEGAARRALVDFIRGGGADAYDRRRDALAETGTSRLSPYLRFGMISPAHVGRALGLPGRLSPGREAFWRQICWRDFYQHHLLRTPHAARRADRPRFDAIAWDDDEPGFRAWREGRTGYPVVDAAMRQLAESGWMHNRARLIAGSFLTKDLLVDWRRGETHFMRHLLDGDPASNNGGWQWVAGTGTDAAPYFRVLNPTRQGQRFDPEGDYVRRHVPELREVPAARIHEPWRMSEDEQRAARCVIGRDYPEPIVDHALQRRAALARYRAATEADA